MVSEKTRLGQRDACYCASNALTNNDHGSATVTDRSGDLRQVRVVLLYYRLIEKDLVVLSHVVSFLQFVD